MFPFFSYTFPLSVFVFFFLASLQVLLATDFPIPDSDALSNDTWHSLMRFLDARKGSHVPDLKRYFRQFGYLPPTQLDPSDTNTTNNYNNNSFVTDILDDEFERALVLYQNKLGLSETGVLDRDTMRAIVSPRCGVQDFAAAAAVGGGLKTTRRYAYFYGKPRWASNSPMVLNLTYAFSPENMIDYVSPSDVREAFGRAFARWSAVIPVNFREVAEEEYSSADIKIGWHRGEHGDGEAFDGVLGVLAHAFSPQNGRFHLDAAERWAVDFRAEKSKVAVDLESVATHEIGHLLGLAHSSVKEAIMYPSLSPRTKKVELQMDDVEGIQALYGSNPDYRYDARAESDISSAGAGRRSDSHHQGLVLIIEWTLLLLLLLPPPPP